MIELILVLAIYSILILLLVPLEKIGRVQTRLKTQVKRWADKVNS